MDGDADVDVDGDADVEFDMGGDADGDADVDGEVVNSARKVGDSSSWGEREMGIGPAVPPTATGSHFF